jgi:hypothetical protein
VPALAAPGPGAASGAPSFDELWATGVEALLQKDYPHARVAFLAARALRPGDGRVGANLKRLADLGFADEQDSNRRG